MTQILIDADRTRDTVILSIQPSVMRVYEARARELGVDVATLLEGLLADWPAILAPVAPKGAVTEAQDFPSGAAF